MTNSLASGPHTFLNYYGGKWRLAPKYPAPEHDTIVEPFAGGAGYSLRHWQRKVELWDVDPRLVGVWQYLIKATEAEVKAIPIVKCVDDLGSAPQEVKWLVGWWLGAACGGGPQARVPNNPTYRDGGKYFWRETIRDRIANDLQYIRHWKANQGSYREIPMSREATWFVDPPYNNSAGSAYKHHNIHYPALASWCKSLCGQVMVCENEGADWLPFQPFAHTQASIAHGVTKEVLWTNT